MARSSLQYQPGQPDFFSREVKVARRYYLDLSPPKSIDLAVVSGGYEECASNYRIMREDFPYYAVEWVVRGKGRVLLNNEEHALSKGSLFCYGPEIAHDIKTDSVRPLAKHFIGFVGDCSQQLLKQAGLLPGSIKSAPQRLDLAWIFESLRRDGDSGGRHAAEACKTLLRYLLVKVASAPSTPTLKESGAHATFVKCDEYLVENARLLVSLTELAEDFGIDEAYLCRLYRRFSSETPYQRLIRLKMNLAADELIESESSVQEVATTFGFSDPFHFSRTFKRVFGVAPTEFRRSY